MCWPVSGLFLRRLKPFEGSFWNMSETVLKQNDGPNAMVATIWCYLIRASSKITKITITLKPLKVQSPKFDKNNRSNKAEHYGRTEGSDALQGS